MPTKQQFDIKSADYDRNQKIWSALFALYDEVELDRQITEFLQRKPKEIDSVYQTRVELFTYENILSACVGFLKAAIFKNAPTVSLLRGNEILSGSQIQPYIEFQKKANQRESLVDLMKNIFVDFALYGRSYVLFDVPSHDGISVKDLKDQGVIGQDGEVRANISTVPVLSLTNYSMNDSGEFEWCVLSYEETRQETFDSKPEEIYVWYVYDRQKYSRYEMVKVSGEDMRGREAVLKDSGPHVMSTLNRVPIERFDIGVEFWLGKRVYYPLKSLLNAENTHAFSLYISNLAMPVVCTDEEVEVTIGQAGFLKFPADTKYFWAEPEGKALVHSADRVARLRESVYRLLYLMYQGRSGSATADGASGSAKEQELQVAYEAMNEFGDALINAAQRILSLVARLRKDDDVIPDVRGMRYGRGLSLQDVQLRDAIFKLDIPSESFEKWLESDLAAKYFEDMDPLTKDKIVQEIMAAKSRANRSLDRGEAELKMATGLQAPADPNKPIEGPKQPNGRPPKVAA